MTDFIDDQTAKRRKVDHVAQSTEVIPCDTEMVLQSISSMSMHGFVFLHQIYAVLNNNTIVDEEIDMLRQRNTKYSFLNFNVCAPKNRGEMIIIEQSRYVEYFSINVSRYISQKSVDINALAFIDKFSLLLTNCNQMSIKRSDIQQNTEKVSAIRAIINSTVDSNNGSSSSSSSSNSRSGGKHHNSVSLLPQFASNEIDWLLEKGFFRLHMESSLHTTSVAGNRSEEVYWLSHPLLGAISKYMTAGEKQILSWIGKTRYKELSEKLLTAADRVNNITVGGSSGGSNSSSSSSGGNSTSSRSIEGQSRNEFSVSNNKKEAKYILIKSSPLPIAYHLLDLEGRGLIHKVRAPATNDHIVRLKK